MILLGYAPIQWLFYLKKKAYPAHQRSVGLTETAVNSIWLSVRWFASASQGSSSQSIRQQRGSDLLPSMGPAVSAVQKTAAVFSSLPCVCPEPVLVNHRWLTHRIPTAHTKRPFCPTVLHRRPGGRPGERICACTVAVCPVRVLRCALRVASVVLLRRLRARRRSRHWRWRRWGRDLAGVGAVAISVVPARVEDTSTRLTRVIHRRRGWRWRRRRRWRWRWGQRRAGAPCAGEVVSRARGLVVRQVADLLVDWRHARLEIARWWGWGDAVGLAEAVVGSAGTVGVLPN